MSSIKSLLLPCCRSSDRVDLLRSYCPSPRSRLFTALALSIILSAGVTLATYCSLSLPPLELSLMAVGITWISTLALYILLRYVCTSKPQPPQKPTPNAPPLLPHSPIKTREMIDEPTLPQSRSFRGCSSKLSTNSSCLDGRESQPPRLTMSTLGQPIKKSSTGASFEVTLSLQDRVLQNKVPTTPLRSENNETETQQKRKPTPTPIRLIREFTKDPPIDLRFIKIGDEYPLVKNLKLENLSQVTREQRNEQKFPWDHFCTFKGVGAKIRSYALKDEHKLPLRHIPWDILKKQPEEILSLFRIDLGINFELRFLLDQLEIEDICQIASALQAEHLEFLYDKHRHDPSFPWQSFFSKPGIGKALRKCLLRESDILTLKTIPWYDLAEEEVRALIPESNFKGETGTLLQNLTFDQIECFAPNLSVLHLLIFPTDKLNHEKFPWKLFIRKGIGEVLRSLVIERTDRLSFKYIPWKSFVDLKEELQILFKIVPDRTTNETLVQGLENKILLSLFRWKVITDSHKTYMKKEQREYLKQTKHLIA